MTGAAIVRDDAVRLYFHAIIWLPLGQHPIVAKLQNLCHMQCTGRELSPELSSDEKKEALQQAMAGKRILLALDDLWEEQHEAALGAFVDVDAGSKVLISTRVKGLLAGAHQVEVGLPSVADSARMLLAAADVDHAIHSQPPAGVVEIVNLCGRLPLAIGMAGRLAASLGLVGARDWSGMIAVLKEELRESPESHEGLIRASLRGLKGSAKEQANVKSLLLLFALVPEDTHCPLEVLLLMFEAVHPDAGVTMMHLRKYLRILIDRSLVLNSIDQASVHDLVLDFAVAQHSTEALRQGHRNVVDAFRAKRPSDAYGRRLYDKMRRDDPVSSYLCNEITYHLAKGWQPNAEQDDLAIKGWLADVPQDALVVAAGTVLGVDGLSSVASRAEDLGDWFLAAQYWAIACIVTAGLYGSGKTSALANKSLDAIDRFLRLHGGKTSAAELEAVNMVQLDQCVRLGAVVDGTFAARTPAVEVALMTPAAAKDPISVFLCKVYLNIHLPFVGKIEEAGRAWSEACHELQLAARSHPDPTVRDKGSVTGYNFPHGLDAMLHGDSKFNWDELYGVAGERLLEAADAYDYQTTHTFLNQYLNVDAFKFMGGVEMPLVVHFGEISKAKIHLERSVGYYRLAKEEVDQVHELFNYMFGFPVLTLLAWSTGLPTESLAAMFEEAGHSWSVLVAQMRDPTHGATSHHPVLRPKGDRTRNAHIGSHEAVGWLNLCCCILLSKPGAIPAEEVMALLPEVAVVRDYATVDAANQLHAVYTFWNVFVHIATVCEKYSQHEQTLVWAAAALETDLTKGGTRLPMNRTLAFSMQVTALPSAVFLPRCLSLPAGDCTTTRAQLTLTGLIARAVRWPRSAALRRRRRRSRRPRPWHTSTSCGCWRPLHCATSSWRCSTRSGTGSR